MTSKQSVEEEQKAEDLLFLRHVATQIFGDILVQQMNDRDIAKFAAFCQAGAFAGLGLHKAADQVLRDHSLTEIVRRANKRSSERLAERLRTRLAAAMPDPDLTERVTKKEM